MKQRESIEHLKTDVGPNLKVDLSKILKKMIKNKLFKIVNIETFNEQLLAHGRVEGVAYYDHELHGMAYKAYNRQPIKRRSKDELLHQLENGWVKESSDKYKVFISVYKKLGLARILHIIDRETKEAKTALFDKELIESI